jgi:hypothetical protein
MDYGAPRASSVITKTQPVEFVSSAEQTLHKKNFKSLWYYQRSVIQKIGKKKA